MVFFFWVRNSHPEERNTCLSCKKKNWNGKRGLRVRGFNDPKKKFEQNIVFQKPRPASPSKSLKHKRCWRRASDLSVFCSSISRGFITLNWTLNFSDWTLCFELYQPCLMQEKCSPRCPKKTQACARTPQTRIKIAVKTNQIGHTVSHGCFWGNL